MKLKLKLKSKLKLQLNCIDSIASSGKTLYFEDKAIERASMGEKVMIAQPTFKLNKETKANIIRKISELGLHNIEVECYTKKAFAGFLNRCFLGKSLHAEKPTKGQILIISHQSQEKLKAEHHIEQWHLLFDEVPPVCIKRYELCISKEIRNIWPYLDFKPYSNDVCAISLPQCKERQGLLGACTKKGDSNQRDFSERLAQGTELLLVDTNDIKAESGLLEVFSIPHPKRFEGYKSTCIACALFEDTYLYHLWKPYVDFNRQMGLPPKLSAKVHKLHTPITFISLTEERWSKHQMQKTLGGEDEKNMNLLIEFVKQTFEGKSFLYSFNNDFTEEPFDLELAKRLPARPEGLNCYSHISNIACLQANNPPPQTCRFLKKIGFTQEQITLGSQLTSTYQIIMRGCARDSSSMVGQVCIIPSHIVAQKLAEKFDKVLLIQAHIPNFCIKRAKAIVLDDKQRTWLIRHRRKLIKSLSTECKLRWGEGQKNSHVDLTRCNSVTFKIFVPLRVTELPDIDNQLEMKCNEFVQFLKSASLESYDNKERISLFGSAVYGDTKSVNTLGLSKKEVNILHNQFLVLDFDGGFFRPEDLLQLLPDTAMIISSTWKPTRFRAIIFVSHLMKPSMYRYATTYLLEKIRSMGFRDPIDKNCPIEGEHAFDNVSILPTQVFRLPSQGKDESVQSFFTLINGIPLDLPSLIEESKGKISDLSRLLPASKKKNSKEPRTSKKNNREIEPSTDSAQYPVELRQLMEEYRELKSGRNEFFFRKLAMVAYKLGYKGLHLESFLKLADYDGARAKDIERIVEWFETNFLNTDSLLTNQAIDIS